MNSKEKKDIIISLINQDILTDQELTSIFTICMNAKNRILPSCFTNDPRYQNSNTVNYIDPRYTTNKYSNY